MTFLFNDYYAAVLASNRPVPEEGTKRTGQHEGGRLFYVFFEG